MRKLWKRLLAMLLTLALCVQILPAPALAYMAEKADSLTLTGKDGGEIEVDESWEERFPYGTFAFQNSELKIVEGGAPGVLQVYRLGGTAGKATAYIQYVPVSAQIDEDRYTYANAAGYGDIRIEVEDPLPIAAYQATGKDPGPAAPDVPITITVEGPAAPEDGDYILTVDAQADAYQWYVLGDGWEEAVSGAVERTFVVGAEDFDRYDLYCVCTIDGVRFGSDSAKGAAYVPEAEETLGTIPEGLPLAPDPTYSTIEMDPEKPYQGYLFAMTFADGEWVKEIRISAPPGRGGGAGQIRHLHHRGLRRRVPL